VSHVGEDLPLGLFEFMISRMGEKSVPVPHFGTYFGAGRFVYLIRWGTSWRLYRQTVKGSIRGRFEIHPQHEHFAVDQGAA
jgi:hypothetical protein